MLSEAWGQGRGAAEKRSGGLASALGDGEKISIFLTYVRRKI